MLLIATYRHKNTCTQKNSSWPVWMSIKGLRWGFANKHEHKIWKNANVCLMCSYWKSLSNITPLWRRARPVSLCRVMGMQWETSGCEHETHQSLINKQLVTVMDCRSCSETGETNHPAAQNIRWLRFALKVKKKASFNEMLFILASGHICTHCWSCTAKWSNI